MASPNEFTSHKVSLRMSYSEVLRKSLNIQNPSPTSVENTKNGKTENECSNSDLDKVTTIWNSNAPSETFTETRDNSNQLLNVLINKNSEGEDKRGEISDPLHSLNVLPSPRSRDGMNESCILMPYPRSKNNKNHPGKQLPILENQQSTTQCANSFLQQGKGTAENQILDPFSNEKSELDINECCIPLPQPEFEHGTDPKSNKFLDQKIAYDTNMFSKILPDVKNDLQNQPTILISGRNSTLSSCQHANILPDQKINESADPHLDHGTNCVAKQHVNPLCHKGVKRDSNEDVDSLSHLRSKHGTNKNSIPVYEGESKHCDTEYSNPLPNLRSENSTNPHPNQLFAQLSGDTTCQGLKASPGFESRGSLVQLLNSIPDPESESGSNQHTNLVPNVGSQCDTNQHTDLVPDVGSQYDTNQHTDLVPNIENQCGINQHIDFEPDVGSQCDINQRTDLVHDAGSHCDTNQRTDFVPNEESQCCTNQLTDLLPDVGRNIRSQWGTNEGTDLVSDVRNDYSTNQRANSIPYRQTEDDNNQCIDPLPGRESEDTMSPCLNAHINEVSQWVIKSLLVSLLQKIFIKTRAAIYYLSFGWHHFSGREVGKKQKSSLDSYQTSSDSRKQNSNLHSNLGTQNDTDVNSRPFNEKKKDEILDRYSKLTFRSTSHSEAVDNSQFVIDKYEESDDLPRLVIIKKPELDYSPSTPSKVIVNKKLEFDVPKNIQPQHIVRKKQEPEDQHPDEWRKVSRKKRRPKCKSNAPSPFQPKERIEPDTSKSSRRGESNAPSRKTPHNLKRKEEGSEFSSNATLSPSVSRSEGSKAESRVPPRSQFKGNIKPNTLSRKSSQCFLNKREKSDTPSIKTPYTYKRNDEKSDSSSNVPSPLINRCEGSEASYGKGSQFFNTRIKGSSSESTFQTKDIRRKKQGSKTQSNIPPSLRSEGDVEANALPFKSHHNLANERERSDVPSSKRPCILKRKDEGSNTSANAPPSIIISRSDSSEAVSAFPTEVVYTNGQESDVQSGNQQQINGGKLDTLFNEMVPRAISKNEGSYDSSDNRLPNHNKKEERHCQSQPINKNSSNTGSNKPLWIMISKMEGSDDVSDYEFRPLIITKSLLSSVWPGADPCDEPYLLLSSGIQGPDVQFDNQSLFLTNENKTSYVMSDEQFKLFVSKYYVYSKQQECIQNSESKSVNIFVAGPNNCGKILLIESFVAEDIEVSSITDCGCVATMTHRNTGEKLKIWYVKNLFKSTSLIREENSRVKSVIILVYSILVYQTLTTIDHYIRFARQTIGNRVPIVLVGNKVDARTSTTIHEFKKAGKRLNFFEDGLKVKEKNNLQAFFECSGKTSKHVFVLFLHATNKARLYQQP